MKGPPHGSRRAPVVERLLADQLGVGADEVRAFWAASPAGARPGTSRVVVTRPPGDARAPAAFVLRPAGAGTYRIVEPASRVGDPVRRLLTAQPQPPFVAGLRGRDGAWTSVVPHREWISGWRVRMLAAFLSSLLLLAPMAWLFGRRMTRPFRALARSIGDGGPIEVGGPRELAEAAFAIGSLRSRLLAEGEERARVLTAVAHDLRTPLTSLRLRLETAPEPSRSRMVSDVDRMQAMIRDVLDFARAERAAPQLVAVRPLLEAVAADFADGAVALLPGEDATVRAVEPAFRRAVENLARNAVDYAGGGVISLLNDKGSVVIEIADTGPGISTAERERLRRPFERGESSRSRLTGGAGLGLAIVEDFALRHGGSLSLGDAQKGGLVAVLRLPGKALTR